MKSFGVCIIIIHLMLVRTSATSRRITTSNLHDVALDRDRLLQPEFDSPTYGPTISNEPTTSSNPNTSDPTSVATTYPPTLKNSVLPSSVPPIIIDPTNPPIAATDPPVVVQMTESPTFESPTTEPPTSESPTSDAPTELVTYAPITNKPTQSPIITPTTSFPTESPIIIIEPTPPPNTRRPTFRPTNQPTDEVETRTPTDPPTDIIPPKETPSPITSTRKPTRRPSRKPTRRPSPRPTEEEILKTLSPTVRNPIWLENDEDTLSPSISPITLQPQSLSPTIVKCSFCATSTGLTYPDLAIPTNSGNKTCTEIANYATTLLAMDDDICPKVQLAQSVCCPSKEDGGEDGGLSSEEVLPVDFTFPPTTLPSYKPTNVWYGPLKSTGLTVILYNMDNIENVKKWEKSTAIYFDTIYNDNTNQENMDGMYDVETEIEVTNVEPPIVDEEDSTRRRQRRRILQNEEVAIAVTYNQNIWYRHEDDVNFVPNKDMALLPLSTEEYRNEYVRILKSALNGYDQLTDVSEIKYANEQISQEIEAMEKGGGKKGMIIGIAIGCVVALLGIVMLGVRKYGSKDNTTPPTKTLEYTNTNNNNNLSSFASNSNSNNNYKLSGCESTSISNSHLENQTIATVDYDYKAAYCGPLSIAGGTLGSAHIMSQTGPDGMDEDTHRGGGGDDTVPGSSGNTIFTGDPTFEQIYEDIQEVFIDVIAPAGKLGVIIDTPNDGAPVIYAVKEASPIVDKVQIGDKLVAIDDEDVRAMSAMKVSKLLSSKSTSHRKLTLIRTEKAYVPNNDNV